MVCQNRVRLLVCGSISADTPKLAGHHWSGAIVDLEDTGEWVFIEAGPDMFQMLYGTPLTRQQIEKLTR